MKAKDNTRILYFDILNIIGTLNFMIWYIIVLSFTSYSERIKRQVFFAPILGKWNYIIIPGH